MQSIYINKKGKIIRGRAYGKERRKVKHKVITVDNDDSQQQEREGSFCCHISMYTNQPTNLPTYIHTYQ